jgi:hypothetical protein
MAKPKLDPALLALPPGIYALDADVTNPNPHARNGGWEFDATWPKGMRFYVRDDSEIELHEDGTKGRTECHTLHARRRNFPKEIRLTRFLERQEYMTEARAWTARLAAILPHLVPDAEPTLTDWLVYVDECCSRYRSPHVGSDYIVQACDLLIRQGIVGLDAIKLALVAAKAEEDAEYARQEAEEASHGSK